MLLNGSVWEYTSTQIQELLDSETCNTQNTQNNVPIPILPTMNSSSHTTHALSDRLFNIKHKNGIQLLNIYTNNKQSLHENVRKWFENKGADFFSWLLTSTQNNIPLLSSTWKKLGGGHFLILIYYIQITHIVYSNYKGR